MYQYSINENDSKNIVDKTVKTQKLLDDFNEIDKKFNNLANSNVELDLQELNFIKPSDDEIKTKAENSLKSYKDTQIDSINTKYDEKAKSLNEDLADLHDYKIEQQSNIEKTYNRAKEEESNDALKRGLGRSSIALNRQSALNDEMLNKLDSLTLTTSKKAQEINSQISLLEEQKQSALGSFDIEYAIKLQDKIDSLNNELLTKEKEVIKYNNEIKELKAKYEQDQNESNYKNISDLAKLYAKYGTGVVDEIKNSQKYQIAKEYFDGMSKEDALLELENNSVYKKQLGAYYSKLLNELRN